MPQQNKTLPLIFALVLTGGIISGGCQQSTNNVAGKVESTQNPISPPDNSNLFKLPQSVAVGTSIQINGSTSMEQVNQSLKGGFENKYTGTTIQTNSQGSGVGIDLLKSGYIDIAATSRPLKGNERKQGLKEVAVAKDAIAIVVGNNNPFNSGLKGNQVADIFQGKIDNWSQLGSKNEKIKVINRPSLSGTYQIFQKMVLGGKKFGSSSNFTTIDQDESALILKGLKQNGISYLTYTQVKNQPTARSLSVDGLTPEAANYPYSRSLYYVYKEPASREVKAFLGYALSPQGQEEIVSGE